LYTSDARRAHLVTAIVAYIGSYIVVFSKVKLSAEIMLLLNLV